MKKKHFDNENIYFERESTSLHDLQEDVSIIDSDEIIKKKKKQNKNVDSDSSTDSAQLLEKFNENVINYIEVDDIIRMKTAAFKEELRPLKEQKHQAEVFIIGYLETIDQECVHLGTDGDQGKIVKTVSKKKAPLKADIVKEGISGEIANIKKVVVTTAEEKKNMIERIMASIENNRETNEENIYLKRTLPKKKKEKTQRGVVRHKKN